MKTAVILPVYNESAHIDGVIKAALPHVDLVVAVDDGSHDKSYEIAKKAGALTLRHKINLGKSAALKTGVKAALERGAKIIIFMDSDGQHLPEDLPRFIEPIEKENYQVVMGARKGGDRMPFVRKLGNTILEWMARFLFGIKIKDIQSGYRSFRSDVYDKIFWKSEGYHADAEITLRTGKHHLRYKQIFIDTIYLNDFKGMSVIQGLTLIVQILLWRISL